jgi:hypothetical protein
MATNQDKLMIDKQAEIITKLREQVDVSFKETVRLRAELGLKKELYDKAVQTAAENIRLKKTLTVYNDLLEQIENNPVLQSEWERFVSILKMAADEDYLKRNGAYRSDDA